MRSRLFPTVVVLALGAALFEFNQPSADAQAPASPLSFTTAQAERGADAYAEHCASCHGPNLDDGAFAPAIAMPITVISPLFLLDQFDVWTRVLNLAVQIAQRRS